MKKIYLAAVLALPFLATEARADGWIFPFRGNVGVNIHWNIQCGNRGGVGGCQLGPWYNYWPLEAHFVTPAPTGYPYWPAPQLPVAPNPMLPPPQPKAGPDVKPVGYSYYPYQTYQPSIQYGPAPSYWYSR